MNTRARHSLRGGEEALGSGRKARAGLSVLLVLEPHGSPAWLERPRPGAQWRHLGLHAREPGSSIWRSASRLPPEPSPTSQDTRLPHHDLSSPRASGQNLGRRRSGCCVPSNLLSVWVFYNRVRVISIIELPQRL